MYVRINNNIMDIEIDCEGLDINNCGYQKIMTVTLKDVSVIGLTDEDAVQILKDYFDAKQVAKAFDIDEVIDAFGQQEILPYLQNYSRPLSPR